MPTTLNTSGFGIELDTPHRSKGETMLNLALETVIVLLVLVGALCGVAGYTIARLGQRRAGGGKTAAELKAELGDYQKNVTEHFQKTAGLLHEMTEQYRVVYAHMAAGAQHLCDPELVSVQIESLRAGLLPGAGSAASTGSAESDMATVDSATIDTSSEATTTKHAGARQPG